MKNRISATDFFTGLFAAFALKGTTTVSIHEQRFDRALAHVFETLMKQADEEGLDIRFRVRLHPIHGDSIAVRDSIYSLAQRDIVSLDNPEFQDIRVKIGPQEAEALLGMLPGGKQLFLPLADDFLSYYHTLVAI